MASKGNAQASLATTLAHLLAVAITTMMLVWLLHFREGVAFRSHIKQKIFNVHPLLMVVGVILLGGEAIMAYKVIPAEKQIQKRVHLTLHLFALLMGIVGIYAVFKFHQEQGIPHVYTLHSWVGLLTIFLYSLQWLFSFFTFAFPHSKATTRATIAPWHIFGGTIIFVLAICTALMGLTEKFTFLKLQRNSEALIINFMGLLIILFTVAVALGVSHPRL